MSYTALYRRLRPRIFDDMVGQNHITKTLKNQIETNRISHAYLFCGTRGTGKTSTAKIFARAINCTDLKNGEPCGVCKICTDILEQRNMDVLEIDAASNNGVDNIREIREEVKYPPTECKYKVYIIDEVHMLSIGAFNALLKTLEEPPEHVIFILATTDPQKIPPTILSRCQRFDFKRISVPEISGRLKKYTLKDNIKITDEALDYIAFISDGAMRDALSILDQCISFYYNEDITINKVKEIVGSVDKEVFYKLTEAFQKFNSGECIKIIDDIILNGRDINQFISELISHFRNMLVAKSISDNDAFFNLSIENFEKLKTSASEIENNTLIYYINTFSNLQNQIKYSSSPRINLEVACIKICNPETDESNESFYSRISKLEQKIKDGILINSKTNSTESKKKPQVFRKKAVPDDVQNVITNFDKFSKTLENPLRSNLNLCYVEYLEDDILYIVSEKEIYLNLLSKDELILKEKIDKYFEKDFKIQFIKESDFKIKYNKLFGISEEQTEDFNISDIKDKLNFDVTEQS